MKSPQLFSPWNSTLRFKNTPKRPSNLYINGTRVVRRVLNSLTNSKSVNHKIRKRYHFLSSIPCEIPRQVWRNSQVIRLKCRRIRASRISETSDEESHGQLDFAEPIGFVKFQAKKEKNGKMGSKKKEGGQEKDVKAREGERERELCSSFSCFAQRSDIGSPLPLSF